MTLQSSSTSPAFEDLSQKIYLLRMPLVLLIILIHARFIGPDYPDDWCKWLEQSVLLGKVPHCAVTVFFVISGYLFNWTDNSNYLALLKKKSNSLLIPYILWNTLLMIVHGLRGVLSNLDILPAFKFAGMTPWQVFIRSYGLDLGAPIDYPLWYVRNLLLFFPLAPLLLWLVRRCPIWLTAIFLVTVSFFMKDCSIIFFCFGMFCRHCALDLRPFNNWWLLGIVMPGAYFILAEFHWMEWHVLQWLSLPFFISIAMLMQRFSKQIQGIIIHLGKYSFWIYCLHAPVATTLARVGLHMHFLGMPPILWIFMNCMFSFAICVMMLRILRRISPFCASLLSGERVPKHLKNNA